MRHVQPFLLATLLVVVAGRPSLAQAPLGPGAPARQLTLDLSVVGLNVGYAVRNSSKTSFGASIGIGGNWQNYMVLGGRHFAESGGLSYEAKDGATDKEVFDLARAGVFVRRHFDSGRQLDVGLKASGFLHSDSSDDDPGGGIFVGLNVTGTWLKWRYFQLGSELNVGGFTEGNPEFGVNVAPLLVRVTFPK
jgi:hypothetical protein